MNVFDEFSWRGLINQTSDDEALRFHLKTAGRKLYCGFDPTARSLHIGNLVPLLALARFAREGHIAYALMGGATGLIGDPSGKDKERQMIDKEILFASADNIKTQVTRLFTNLGCAENLRVVNNYDWTNSLSTIEFLRDVGKYFTVNYMMAKDSVKNRIGREDTGISFTEFSYMILQSYDFYHLSEHHDLTMQIGGSDQFGNITAGLELIRKKSGKECFALTFPLITTASGAKFGKSEKGAIYLDPEMTSPYAFYQYWMNTDDRDVINYLRYFTFLNQQEIADLETELAERPHERAAQRRLAEETTTMIHGKEELENVQGVTEALFGKGDIKSVNAKTLAQALESAPGKSYGTLDALPDFPGLLVDLELCNSKSQARKDIKAGGIYINNERQQDEAYIPIETDFIGGRIMLVRKGKKNYGVVFLGQ